MGRNTLEHRGEGRKRLPGLDFLRELLLALGVIYHSLQVLFVEKRVPTNEAVGIFLWLSHAFRIPLFFLVSGYVSSSLIDRKGARYFLANRRNRLLWPLLAAILILLAPVNVFDEFHLFLHKHPDRWPEFFSLVPEMLFETFVHQPTLSHLWFLVYLFTYALALGAWHLLLAPKQGRDMSRRKTLMLFAAVLLAEFSAMLFMKRPTYVDGAARVVRLGPFLAYAGYFFFGVGLFRAASFDAVTEWFLRLGWIAALAVFLSSGFSKGAFDSPAFFSPSVTGLLYGAMGISFAYFVYGCAKPLQFGPRVQGVVRYLISAGIWIYLIHTLFIYVFDFAMQFFGLSLLGRAILLPFLSYGACLLSFHWFVRETWLGVFLNGKKAAIQRREGSS